MYKLTIPNDPTSLRAAAEFFAGLCGCLVEPKPQPMTTDESATYDRIINAAATLRECANQPTTVDEFVQKACENADQKNVFVAPPPEPVVPQDSVYKDLKEFVVASVDHIIKQTADGVAEHTIEPDPATIFANGPVAPHINYTGPVPSTIAGQPVPPPPADDRPDTGPMPPPVTTPSVITDKNGLPWDARIHAATKSTIADGSWRVRKQPATMNKEEWEAYVSQIMAELEGAMAVPIPPPATPATYKTLAELTAAILAAGKTPAEVQAACTTVDLAGYPMLNSRPDLIPAVAAALGI